MGPGDPFARAEREAPWVDPPGSAPPARNAAATGPSPTSGARKVVLAGVGLGAALGLLLLTGLLFEGLVIAFFGALGGALGWVAYGILTGRLAVGAAWRTLRGQ